MHLCGTPKYGEYCGSNVHPFPPLTHILFYIGTRGTTYGGRTAPMVAIANYITDLETSTTVRLGVGQPLILFRSSDQKMEDEVTSTEHNKVFNILLDKTG